MGRTPLIDVSVRSEGSDSSVCRAVAAGSKSKTFLGRGNFAGYSLGGAAEPNCLPATEIGRTFGDTGAVRASVARNGCVRRTARDDGLVGVHRDGRVRIGVPASVHGVGARPVSPGEADVRCRSEIDDRILRNIERRCRRRKRRARSFLDGAPGQINLHRQRDHGRAIGGRVGEVSTGSSAPTG